VSTLAAQVLHRSLLQGQGFKRRKQTWNRQANDLIQVVQLVPSKSGVSLDVVLGVCEPALFSRLWGPLKGFANAEACLASLELSELTGDPVRRARPDDLDDITFVARHLEAEGLPWLSRMSDRANVLRFLRARPYVLAPSEAVLLALFESQLGLRDAACETFADVIQRALGTWKVKAQELAAEEGCNIQSASTGLHPDRSAPLGGHHRPQ
jgi:Domain of unknown function (DUF4304)